MSAGDKEVLEAYKDVTTRNVVAAVEHGNTTRKLLREQEAKIKSLDGLVRGQQEMLVLIKQQLAVVQAQIFKGGTSVN